MGREVNLAALRTSTAKGKSTAALLVEAGPPREWSGAVALLLGKKYRKRIIDLWSALSPAEKAATLDAFHKSFEAEDVVLALEDTYGELAKAASPYAADEWSVFQPPIPIDKGSEGPGLHFHHVKLPDGTVVKTELDGAHTHYEGSGPSEMEMRKILSRDIPIFKADEERFVMGIVLEPNNGKSGAPLDPDSQQDIYSSAEVRTAAHKFMEDFRNLGLMHVEFINGAAKILESFLAPVDFEMGTTKVRKGTWLLAIRVLDDALWRQIKSGELTGFSIGGSALRQPARVS